MKFSMMSRAFVAFCAVSATAASNSFRRASVLNASATPSNTEALRKIEQGVKSLKVPALRSKQLSPSSSAQQAGQTSGCSFLGGIVSAQLSKQCCTSVRVVSQRQLDQYGMAQQCEPDWQCEADGRTPMPSFETQALSSMCGQPGCLPSVVAAMQSNVMTKGGADEMGGICATLASIGGSSANPEQVSQLLTGAASRGRSGKGGSREGNSGSTPKCNQDKKVFCKDDNKNKTDYKVCCVKKKGNKSNGPACFPGEAVAFVDGKGKVPLARLRTGERVLVERQGELIFEPVLSFLHAIRKPSGESMVFMTVTHTYGQFRASAAHIVFVADSSAQGWKSTLVGKLQVGDEVFAAAGEGAPWGLKPSRVLAVQESSTQFGMYAPLTSSGTIVVDGVVASNYASSSENKHLPHRLAHAFLFPVRIYHYFGLGSRLQPLWQRLCSSPMATNKRWFCQGGDTVLDGTEAETEELHPYLRVMWKGFKLDVLL